MKSTGREALALMVFIEIEKEARAKAGLQGDYIRSRRKMEAIFLR